MDFTNAQQVIDYVYSRGNTWETVRVVNDSPTGRRALDTLGRRMAHNAVNTPTCDNRSKAYWIGLGGCFERAVVSLGKENLDYPKVPYNEAFMTKVSSFGGSALVLYHTPTVMIYLGHTALKSLDLSSHEPLAKVCEWAVADSKDAPHFLTLAEQMGFTKEQLPKLDPSGSRIQELLKGLGLDLNMNRSEVPERFSASRRAPLRDDDLQDLLMLCLGTTLPDVVGKQPFEMIDLGVRDNLLSYVLKAVWNDKRDLDKRREPFDPTRPMKYEKDGEKKTVQISTETFLNKSDADKREEDGEPYLSTIPDDKLSLEEKVEGDDAFDVRCTDARLTNQERLVVNLHIKRGEPHEEIARFLGITPANARKVFSRAQAKLRKNR